MKFSLLAFSLCLFFSYAEAQQADRYPIGDYQELPDPAPVNAESWNRLKSDAPQISWGSTDVRYAKSDAPELERTNRCKLTAWKGERVNAQAVLWTKKEINNLTVSMSDLKSSNGDVIPASDIKTGFLRYVMTDELSKDGSTGCGVRTNKAEWDSSLVADAIDYTKTLDVKARTTQPVWTTIWVPATVKAGTYKGNMTFAAEGEKPQTLAIEVKVLNRTLPAPKDWSIHLDLWQNPFSVARYYQVPLWSDAHLEAMRPVIKQLADAGQKVITASVMYKPWGGQTEDYFETMVNRTLMLDGSWRFDYDIFDKWVEFMMGMGIDEQINCYSLIPWALSFQYFDQASNSLKFINAKPGDAAYEEYWSEFLKSFAAHLKQKGWFEKTTIAMDERALGDMQIALRIIKKADPNFKISLAGNYHQEIEPDMYDYCLAFGHNFPADVKAKREQQGKKSTYYTCCAEARPNTFTFSPLAEATWIGWHIAAGNYDGYLRWAYNSWTDDPLRDSRFRTWAAGDCYMVYPGNRSSIRMERLVEGIQDFEKIQILKKEFEQTGATAKLDKLNKVLAEFQLEQLVQQQAAPMVKKGQALLNSF